jgi:thiamine-monophosphate kinase
MGKAKGVGEKRFIELVERAVVGTSGALLGVGDDCALLPPPKAGRVIAITTDTLVEKVHFRRDWATPRQIGAKLAAVNLSDIAGMGALPTFAFLSVSLTPDVDEPWVARFLAAFVKSLGDHGARLVGGNMTAAPRDLSFTVTLVGEVEAGKAIRRDGARPGDLVCVTGRPGEAALGYDALAAGRRTSASRLVARHLTPTPRVEWGRVLRGLATAGMDISDGVALDLSRLLTASGGLSAVLDLSQFPRSRSVCKILKDKGTHLWRRVLTGGEDYELLFTIRPSSRSRLARMVVAGMIDATVIGRVAPPCDAPITVLLPDGSPLDLPSHGWWHS